MLKDGFLECVPSELENVGQYLQVSTSFHPDHPEN